MSGVLAGLFLIITQSGRVLAETHVQQRAYRVRSSRSDQEVNDLLAVLFQDIVTLLFVVSWQVVADFLQKLYHTLLKQL